MTDKPASTTPLGQQQGEQAMAPGDEAPPGTPGTGEDVCPECGGSGRLERGPCETCLGRGRVVKAISAGP
jgi:DnaJ-class molecular chaperone